MGRVAEEQAQFLHPEHLVDQPRRAGEEKESEEKQGLKTGEHGGCKEKRVEAGSCG